MAQLPQTQAQPRLDLDGRGVPPTGQSWFDLSLVAHLYGRQV